MLTPTSNFFFFSSRRRHTRCSRDWSSDVCSSDLATRWLALARAAGIEDAQNLWLRQRAAEKFNLVNQTRKRSPIYNVPADQDRKSTRLNSSHGYISYAVFCLKKKKTSIKHQFSKQ